MWHTESPLQKNTLFCRTRGHGPLSPGSPSTPSPLKLKADWLVSIPTRSLFEDVKEECTQSTEQPRNFPVFYGPHDSPYQGPRTPRKLRSAVADHKVIYSTLSGSSEYVALAHLGEGHAFVAWKCSRSGDSREYAVKKSSRLLRGIRDRDRLIGLVPFLPKHPNIVEHYEIWQSHGHLYFAMELCSLTLDQTGGKLNLWNSLLQISSGLLALHSRGILHLDLKPENILVVFSCNGDSTPTLKICDFESSVLVGQFEHGNEGDHEYMAPECLDVHTSIGPAADVYSLGMLISRVWVPSLLTVDMRIAVRGLVESMTRTDPDQRVLLEDILRLCQTSQANL